VLIAGLRILLILVVGLPIVVIGGPIRSFAQARGSTFGECLPIWLHRAICFLLGVRVRRYGAPSGQRPQLVVANHVSWLDVFVLGALRPTEFLAKTELGPPGILRTIVALQGIVFVNRSRPRQIPQVNAEMARHMRAGAALVLFAEATTGDGNRLLPFRSSHFEALRGAIGESGAAPRVAIVQPVFLAYSRRGGLPIGRAARPRIAWYGDMPFFSHLLDFLRAGQFDCDIYYGEWLQFTAESDRKAVARQAETAVRALAESAFRAPNPSHRR
jgi:1-acyl-sn-glycerol-3-phosphate acyltransferase